MINGGKTIAQHGNERLVLGYHKPPEDALSDTSAKAALDNFDALLRAGGASTEVADIEFARWRKVLWYD